MRKFFVVLTVILLLTTSARAASLFTTTILDVSIPQVQNTLIDVFTGRNFTIDVITPYTMTFQKSFGDGIWITTELNTVKCNLIEVDGNVRLMVTQTAVEGGQKMRQRAINHLVPLITEVKHRLDGTPKNIIRNEATNQIK